ncbi:hypothetical protein GCM10011416_03170 [Polaribacter pacificus]|uniref:Uncharacterized protein n=1 Tax=Polaribacter pacificus TaxID=1775173 RepID=A0A917MBK8_9FLAO|nr:hypothetical protein GCM10011416_03170 [Polaribacter pacificus]
MITFSAIRSAMSSPSIEQGPASKKKLPELMCLIDGINERFIEFIFLQKYKIYIVFELLSLTL